jgi:uncharacterized protein (DUF488 family)
MEVASICPYHRGMETATYLYTLGYEGQTIEHFMDRLAEVGVQTVIDVRDLPLSRKRGFSKRALAGFLAERDIGYVHMPALGCPKPIRDRLKADGDWPRYVRDFRTHMAKQREPIAKVAEMARVGTCALLCFEADFDRCHRSLVARRVAEAGGPLVAHITATATIPDVARRVAA